MIKCLYSRKDTSWKDIREHEQRAVCESNKCFLFDVFRWGAYITPNGLLRIPYACDDIV